MAGLADMADMAGLADIQTATKLLALDRLRQSTRHMIVMLQSILWSV
jgi:hypothetical protein